MRATSIPPASDVFSCRECGRRAVSVHPGARCEHDGHVLVRLEALEAHPHDPVLGRCLAGKLSVFDVLSDAGGFHRVYLGIQEPLGREVAIKVVRPERLDDGRTQSRSRFLQEARMLAELKDARIVALHEVMQETLSGPGDPAQEDALYMVLERAPGRSLREILVREHKLPVARAVRIVREVLLALEVAHRAQLVHRDLKPANVIVDESQHDRVTLIDFGIAKRLAGADAQAELRTTSGLLLGTPGYMAPEQLQTGGQAGPATDLYAAGAMLYELITGSAPFAGTEAEIVAAHLYEPAPELPAEVPEPVRAVVTRALAKRPRDRFVSAGQMAEALRHVEMTEMSALSNPAVTRDVTRGVESEPRKRTVLWAAMAAVVLVAIAIVGLRAAPRDALGPEPQNDALVSSERPAPAGEAAPAPAREPTASNDPKKSLDAGFAGDVHGLLTVETQRAPVGTSDAGRASADEPKRALAYKPRGASARSRAAPTVTPKEDAAQSAIVSRVREHLKQCRCAQAREVLASLGEGAQRAMLADEVQRCRPRLVGQPCRYLSP